MSSTARRAAPLRTKSSTGIVKPEAGVAGNGTSSTSSAPNTASSAATRASRLKEDGTTSTITGASRVPTAVAGTRKRSALGDLTNANRAKSNAITSSRSAGAPSDRIAAARTKSASTSNGNAVAGSSKVPRVESSVAGGKRLASRADEGSRGVVRRAVPSNGARSTTAPVASTRPIAGRVPSTASSRAGSTRPSRIVEGDQEGATVEQAEADRENKRIKVDDSSAVVPVSKHSASQVEAKDAGWEDLDQEDIDDPLMVAEYVNEIFAYMKRIETTTLPNGGYMDTQNEIDWTLRGVLVDWLIDTHSKFRMLPETLFLALNVVDRFLTVRTITLNKLQLVGLTAMFIAAKYEEVLCPSVANFLYLADGGYTTEEILKAERYMLKVLKFNLSYANPMNFLRRISKADNYDIQTRTVAKYFMEISLVDHRLMEHPPSLVAAAAVWMARKVLERGPWTPTLVHYSSYSEYELLGTAEIMLDFLLRPVQHQFFHKKYAGKKFMRASTYCVDWAQSNFADAVVPASEIDYQDFTQLRVDLFADQGLVRPASSETGSNVDSESRATTPNVAAKQANDDWESSVDRTEE